MRVVPFACCDDDGTVDVAAVVKRRATRCALSRICGMCGETLSRPIAFVGPQVEADENRFAFPPMHLACAREVVQERSGTVGGFLGHPTADGDWALVTTAGFDLVRPTRHGDPVHFSLNSVLESVALEA